MLTTAKTLLLATLGSMTITACGSDLSTASLNAKAGDGDTATIIDGIAVEPANGGIAPGWFAMEIAGNVLVGSNPCMAAGRTAELQVSEADGVMHVIPTLHRASDEDGRTCTQEFNPVIERVNATVRGDLNLVKQVVAHNVGGAGQSLDVRQWFGQNPVVMDDTDVNRVNGGINPDAFALAVKAKVELGANPCVAANQTVELMSEQVGGITIIRANAKVLDPAKVCTMEYNPVFGTRQTIVRGFQSTTNTVLLVNVGEPGRIVDVSLSK